MDLNDLRSIMTVVSLATFIGIVWWAFGPRRKDAIESHGLIPFDDADEQSVAGVGHDVSRQRS